MAGLAPDTAPVLNASGPADGEAPQLVRPEVPAAADDDGRTKLCAYCGQLKPLSDFKRRTGQRRGATARRGACKACRAERREPERVAAEPEEQAAAETGGLPEAAADSAAVVDTPETAPRKKKRRRRRRRSKSKAAQAKLVSADPGAAAAVKKPPVTIQVSLRELKKIGLVPSREGFIRMRGRTDNGRRWYQEIEPGLAWTLVKERAAVVVNRQTIQRLYSNKEFRRLILERDQYTCRFCGQYGDTIDHMLPRAKGGHTTPDNCVCACHSCNQSKADRDLEEFIQ